MLNPDPGAAIGTRAATMHRINDAFLGCIAQALPDMIPTAGAGGATIVLVSTRHPATGKQLVSVIEPITGGGGARPFKDGVDGTDAFSSTVRNIPIEILEAELPILVHAYRLRPDSAGRGQYRGGMGIEMEFELLSDSASVTARGMERRQFRPWGRAGGTPGELGTVIMNRGSDRERVVEAVDVVQMGRGDRLYFGGQGGGGFGSPQLRSAEAGTQDRIAELVTIDRPESEGAAASASPAAFVFGPERARYEELWPDEVMSEFSRRLSGMDGFRQQRIKEYLIRKARNEGLSSLSRLDRLWQETMQEMGFLPTIQGVTVKVR
jgi:N-methylhydantoinase B